MAFVAERLPVIHVPEEVYISFVRRDMVDFSCRFTALHAERIQLEKGLSRFMPLVAVASLIRVKPLFVLSGKYLLPPFGHSFKVFSIMQLTVRTMSCVLIAASMRTGPLCSDSH